MDSQKGIEEQQKTLCIQYATEYVATPGKAKAGLLDELRKLNINEFSIYNDLDHLAQEIKRTRNIS